MRHGEVPAMRERHAEDRVARAQHREIHRLVRLRARMRLHVRVLRAVQALCPVDGERLDLVDVLAAAVIAAAGIALRVFVGELRARRLQHRRAHIVFRGDELDVVLLAAVLGFDRVP